MDRTCRGWSTAEVRDFDRSSGDRVVQQADKHSGLPLWVVEVIDADPDARQRTVKVKIAAQVQPVLPPPQHGVPGRQQIPRPKVGSDPPTPVSIPLRGGHVSLLRRKVAGMLLRAAASAGVELADELAVVRTDIEPRTPAMQDA